jgi:hypothetical protein
MSNEKDQELNESFMNYNPEVVIHQDKLYCKIVHNLNLIHEEYRKQNVSYFMSQFMKREGVRFWMTDIEFHLEIPLPDKELSVEEITNISNDIEQLMSLLQSIMCDCVEADQELDAIMSQMQ